MPQGISWFSNSKAILFLCICQVPNYPQWTRVARRVELPHSTSRLCSTLPLRDCRTPPIITVRSEQCEDVSCAQSVRRTLPSTGSSCR